MTSKSEPIDPSNAKLAPVDDHVENRSDLNDGVNRPLGFFSSQAQADRNAVRPGSTETNEAAGGPGFFSPEQQMARNTPPGAVSPTPLEPGEQIAPEVDADVDEPAEKRSAGDYHKPR